MSAIEVILAIGAVVTFGAMLMCGVAVVWNQVFHGIPNAWRFRDRYGRIDWDMRVGALLVLCLGLIWMFGIPASFLAHCLQEVAR
jgi:uncharacterized membrane protein